MSLKVLHINDVAGVGTNLVYGLQSLGIQAELIKPTLGTYQASKLRRFTLPIIRTWEAYQLRRLFIQERYDIVHIHYARFAYMALLTKIPYCLHCHGSDLRLDLNNPILRGLTIHAIRKAQSVFYSTPDLKQYLDTIREDTIFLPNPIILDTFSPTSRESRQSKRILSISKLDRYKGLDKILRTIELVWLARPNIEFGLMNFGNARSQAQKFINTYHNKTQLKLIPRTPHKKIPSLINEFSFVLGHLSSIASMLTISELEAMACEKAVVCNFTYLDAYPETPPVLISTTPEEAKDHILNLLDNPGNLNEIGNRSREWVMNNHDHIHIAKVLLKYYQAI